MPTLLVKNVPEDLLKELRKIKAETGCKTWAELLSYLVKQREKQVIILDDSYRRKARRAVDEFLDLREIVSKRWQGSVLGEFRKARRHGDTNPHA